MESAQPNATDIIPVIQKGQKPKVLFMSGMHGDEFEVIDIVQSYIEKNREMLPDFYYIPQVSPSAVSRRTRTNRYEHDVNRYFIQETPDPEIRMVTELLKPHTFEISLDFHEDPDRTDSFYMYDSGQLTESELRRYHAAVLKTGALLHNGIDDETDETLGYTIVDGYISIAHQMSNADTGFSSGWLLRHGVAQRSYTLEIPGNSGIPLKKALVESMIEYFIPGKA